MSFEQQYEYNTIQGWYKANKDFLIPGQSLNRLLGIFCNAQEQAAADSVNDYLVASRYDYEYPSFNKVLEDFD